MWLPTRSIVTQPLPSTGFARRIAIPNDRVPTTGYSADSRYIIPSFESFFEALETMKFGSSPASDSVYTLDFGPDRGTWTSFNPVAHFKRSSNIMTTKVSYDASGFHNVDLPILSVWENNFLGSNCNAPVVIASVYYPFAGHKQLWGGTDRGVYADDENLSGYAFQQLLPGIRPGTSLINSIYELKDLKTIPLTLARIHKALDQLEIYLGKKLKSLSRYASRETLKTLVGGAADVHLQSKFNVLPMLQDITAVDFAINNVKGQLKRLTSEAQRPLTKHFSAPLMKFNDSRESVAGSSGASWPNALTFAREVVYVERMFRATIQYHYELDDTDPVDLYRHGLADYLGLQVSPQVIWNAIPFSFVVDWILGIGPWLSQFTMKRLGIVTHISQAGISIKVKRKATLRIEQYGQVGTFEEESYYRTPADVPLVSSIRSSGLNSTEFTLASSMVITARK
jgi:hypothetical protein